MQRALPGWNAENGALPSAARHRRGFSRCNNRCSLHSETCSGKHCFYPIHACISRMLCGWLNPVSRWLPIHPMWDGRGHLRRYPESADRSDARQEAHLLLSKALRCRLLFLWKPGCFPESLSCQQRMCNLMGWLVKNANCTKRCDYNCLLGYYLPPKSPEFPVKFMNWGSF